jgi:hypothetical protein
VIGDDHGRACARDLLKVELAHAIGDRQSIQELFGNRTIVRYGLAESFQLIECKKADQGSAERSRNGDNVVGQRTDTGHIYYMRAALDSIPAYAGIAPDRFSG